MGARKRIDNEFQQSLDIKSWMWVCYHRSYSDADIEKLREKLLVCTIQEIADRRTSKAVAEECWRWILSDAIEPFSFRVCCDASDLDPDKMRKALIDEYITMTRRSLARELDLEALQEAKQA